MTIGGHMRSCPTRNQHQFYKIMIVDIIDMIAIDLSP